MDWGTSSLNRSSCGLREAVGNYGAVIFVVDVCCAYLIYGDFGNSRAKVNGWGSDCSTSRYSSISIAGIWSCGGCSD